ncbi:MAG TPA: YfaZ family outer membrane protein [Buttiauxella sp.]|nr:YfaZ family outer membrane protein [Buttiauxella sp.]
MNKLLKVGVAGLALISASASAISISGEAGEEYTNIAVGFGTETSGLAMTGNYAHNDDDGDVAGLGLGLNVPLGPLMGTVGGRAVYLNPNDGDEGYALAVGGGLSWKIFDSFAVFGDYYYSPDSLSSGVENYQEASAGARWTILRPITVEAGYRYIGMENKDGYRDNTIADGPYVGVSAAF